MSIKKIILVKKKMDHLEEENYPEKRSTFLTVLCILTFIGSGWALFSAGTAYNTAEQTVGVFSGPIVKTKKDTLVIAPKNDTFSREQGLPDSINDELAGDDSMRDEKTIQEENESDSISVEDEMGSIFGEKLKTNVMDMMSVEKIKNSAMGRFIAALFTLAGAIFMWRLRKYGFTLYIIGIAIGIIVPFYIYGSSNLLAIGLTSYPSFIGLLFIALYALNLKSMK